MQTRNRISKASAATVAIAVLAAVALSSCANMTPTQQRATTGTMMGAAGGAAIGAIAGNAGMGAAIGAGAGLLGGLMVDRHEKAKQSAYEQGRYDAQHGR
jgi:hypothetical protein